MSTISSPHRLVARLKVFTCGSGYLAIGVGLLVLAGWWAHVEMPEWVRPGMFTMNPSTAICFVMAGASLCSSVRRGDRSRSKIEGMLALVVLGVGLVRVGYFMVGWHTAPDHWMFGTRQYIDGMVARDWISPNTSIGLVFLGLALFLIDRPTRRVVRVSEAVAMALGQLALLALIGYFYEIEWLYGVDSRLPMAIHTAAVFLFLALGIVSARPDQGIMSVVTGDSSGGLLARRMLPAVVVTFILAGALGLLGERRGYYDAEQGVALYVVGSIVIFGLVVLWSARSLHLAEIARLRVVDEYERFFALSLDLFGVAGTDGYFKRVNPAFRMALGYSDEEILSHPFVDLVHPEDVVATLAEVEKLKGGQPTLHFENRYRCKDGSWKWLSWNTRPFPEDGVLYAAARDFTEQKQSEEANLALNAELLQQTSQLKSLNQELESFSYSVSHDLRAPLRGISGFAEALEEHAAANLDSTELDYLQRIRNAAARMGDLIDDLLKLSRLTRAEMTLESVNLSVLAESIVAELQRAAPERRVEMVIAPEILINGDHALLRILLENLLGNAWKFTANRPSAKIELGASRLEDGRMSCFVRDNGVGFDNRYAHKVFGAFQRLHSQAEFPGTGIGLATVQRIVHRHGGEVRAEGSLGHGATFAFTLDAKPKREIP